MIVRLRHVNHNLKLRREYFYDGSTMVVDGVVSIDSDERNHLSALLIKGYRVTPEGVRLNNMRELDRYIASLTAKSEEEGYEPQSIDRRRQPAGKDRVRSR